MRIIAGRFRGRRLNTLAGGRNQPSKLRPTSDRLRETLFNVLSPVIENSVFLDCYAGTGAVGLEALSRGAAEVIWIEAHEPAARLIEANAHFLPPDVKRRLIRKPVLPTLAKLEREGVRVDICFMDPPYEEAPEAMRNLARVAGSGLMQRDGLLILEHSRRFESHENLGSVEDSDDSDGSAARLWTRTRLLVQGDSALSFYRRSPAAD